MIELRTNGKKVINHSNVNVTLSLDTVASTFSFDGYFDQEKESLRNIYKPFTYQKADVWFVDEKLGINQKLITGTILNQGLSVQKQPQLTNISGYSVTGLFEDVSIPEDLYPLEYNGLGLKDIVQSYCDYFGIRLYIYPNALTDVSIPFEKAKSQPGETIKSFISKLASSRNITVAHDNLGRLILYKVLAQIPPAAKIDENDKDVVRISMKPNGQAMHSSITIIRQASFNDDNAGQYTAISPFVPSGIKRPKVKTLQFGTNNDTKAMAEAEICREAKNFPIIIEKEGWTIGGKLLRSGFYIELTAPSLFLQRTKLVIQNINFKDNKKDGKTTTITCVHPCVYTGVIPKKSPFK